MRPTSRSAPLTALLVALASGIPTADPAAPSRPEATLDRRFSLATLAAAEASLRLHETDAAQRWLDQTLSTERGFELDAAPGAERRRVSGASTREPGAGR